MPRTMHRVECTNGLSFPLTQLRPDSVVSATKRNLDVASPTVLVSDIGVLFIATLNFKTSCASNPYVIRTTIVSIVAVPVKSFNPSM